MMSQEEFWRENGTWTWSLAVILLILAYRFLRPRFRRSPFPSSAASTTSTTTPTTDDSPSIRNQGIISDLDLKNLINNLDENYPDENVWENVIDKSTDSISYKAKCCKQKDRPLKYLSVTIFENCSVDMLVNFYMDNEYRMKWDKTVVQHQQLQVDHGSGTEIGRTIKKFPFLTAREYVLAWKLWLGIDGSVYCVSKECNHHLAPKDKKYVRVALFRSGWRIRKVPGRNACEIRMVHQEDAGLNLEMAKMAFSKGIWSYVCKMDNALRKYPAEKQHQLNSTSSTMYIQKVPPNLEVKNPPNLEVKNDVITTVHQEKPTAPASYRSGGTCKPNLMKLTRRPSNKLITNGLVILGGAICLSRGHSSLGAKVAIAYMLGKLTKRGVSSSDAGNPSFDKDS